MGFNFGGMLTGAISGAASGFMMGGGPYGAIAGGVIGGAAGGFGAGPSSIGGITGGKAGSGAAAGRQQREYWDEANPGTNAWERLGAGGAMAGIMSAGVAAKQQDKNAKLAASTVKQTSINQANAAVKVAEINKTSAGYVAETHAGPAAIASEASRDRVGIEQERAGYEKERTAFEGRRTTSEEETMKFRRRLADIEGATKLGSAHRSAAADLAVRVYDYAKTHGPTETDEFAQKHLNKLKAAGWTIEGVRDVREALGLGSSRTIRGGRKVIPRRTSVPGAGPAAIKAKPSIRSYRSRPGSRSTYAPSGAMVN